MESELVSGFMTEHSAAIFVKFFLAEYASIVTICILTSIFFLGGYLFNFSLLIPLTQFISFDLWLNLSGNGSNDYLVSNSLLGSLDSGIILGIKTCALIFTFIWCRASLPRIRFDQLMSYCWTEILPIVIALIFLVIFVIFSFEIIPTNISLLITLPVLLKGVSKDSDSQISHIKMTDLEFNQWFSGFTDGEGCFIIGKIKDTYNFYFRFSIKLHVDDLKALEFIKSRLNCGVTFTSGNAAYFNVTKISDIFSIILPLFGKFNLNGIKHLDFLAFKKAVLIYLHESLSKSKKSELIIQLKDSMNNKRENLSMPYSHIKITPYGLLGLIEGEGTFCLNDPKNMGISFSLALTYSQKSLIQAIKQFIDNYDIADTYLKYSSNLSEIVDKRSYLTIKQGTGIVNLL